MEIYLRNTYTVFSPVHSAIKSVSMYEYISHITTDAIKQFLCVCTSYMISCAAVFVRQFVVSVFCLLNENANETRYTQKTKKKVNCIIHAHIYVNYSTIFGKFAFLADTFPKNTFLGQLRCRFISLATINLSAFFIFFFFEGTVK